MNLTSEEAKHLEGLIEGLGEGTDLPPQGASAKATLKDAPEYRSKSPLKLRYSAEVEIIRKRWGSLEDIRHRLGLSQRKMSQLLMVDPSAWTRWTRYDQDVPPHIYRALSWYLQLQEKDPSQTPYNFLQAIARPSLPKAEIRNIEYDLHQSLKARFLEDSKGQMTRANRQLKFLLIANAVIASGVLGIFLYWILTV